MAVKTPSFWYKRKGWQSALLMPLATLYQLGHRLRFHTQKPYKSPILVLCVGNIVMGGSGKTPTVQALIKLVKEKKLAKNPVILTRGYGGTIRYPTIVEPSKHTAFDVGDEALLLAQSAPVIVSPNRQASAKKAEKLGTDLIIMDDGFQNNQLYKDINLLVIDAFNPFGNGLTFPAGPLREPIKNAFKRADAIISLNGKTALGMPTFTATITPDTSNLDQSQRYVAFAGLGRPEKFLNTLTNLDLNIINWRAFADHHPYKEAELCALEKEAKERNALLITTEKDFMRLPLNKRAAIKTLPITLSFNSDEERLASFLKERIEAC